MRSIAALVTVLLVPVAALAWGKKEEKKPARAALPALKAGIHHQCLTPLAEKKDPAGLVGMGILDQTKGDLKAAKLRYMDAFMQKHDVVASPLDLTYVNGVIWIQTKECPVPVPAAPAAETIELSPLKVNLRPDYPEILLSIRAEGDVSTTVVIGADGRPTWIHVDSSSIGPVVIQRIRERGEEEAERQVSRVQLALQSIEDLRRHDFGAENAGKSLTWKLSYIPNVIEGAHPGRLPNTAGPAGSPGVPGLGSGSGKPR